MNPLYKLVENPETIAFYVNVRQSGQDGFSFLLQIMIALPNILNGISNKFQILTNE